MNTEQFELFVMAQREVYKLYREGLELNKQLLQKVSSIERKLEILTSDRGMLDPNYEKSLAEYPDFDWSSIEAEVISRDSFGVSQVEWRNRIYKRRNPENKFAPAIWFSRHDGEQYQKLITFKTINPAEPISCKVVSLLSPSSNIGCDRPRLPEEKS